MQRNEIAVDARRCSRADAARPEQRQPEPGRLGPARCTRAAPPTRRTPANLAEAAQVHGRAGLRRLRRGPEPVLLRPRHRRRARGPDWPAYPGPDGPRAAAVHAPPAWTSRATSRTATTTGSCRATRTGTPPSRTSRRAASRRSEHRRRCRSAPDGLDPSVLLSPSSAGDAGSARPAAAVRGQAPDQGRSTRRTARTTRTATSSSTRTRTSTPPAGATLLRLGPARGARHPLHLDRHALRGRHRRAVLERQHRRPSVPVARARAASSRPRHDKLIVVFGHHPIRSLNSNAPDEAAGPCTGVTHTHGDVPEHDQNPGCDIDPRTSTPIHYGEPSQRPPGNTDETLSQLLDPLPARDRLRRRPHAREPRAAVHRAPAAECGGASRPRPPPTGRCSTALIEVMDNLDGTLSIFGTVLDAASASQAPAPGLGAGLRRGDAGLDRPRVRLQRPAGGPRLGRGHGQRPERRAAGEGPAPREPRAGQVRQPRPGAAGRDLTYTLIDRQPRPVRCLRR